MTIKVLSIIIRVPEPMLINSDTGWLEMTNYYATAFKTGRYPPITKERIYLWSRPHSKYASAPDHVDRPNNWDWTEDYLWATLFATAPGSLTIASGPNSGQFNVPYSGVHKFKVPSGLGRMSATMYRNGIAVWNFNPDGFQYTDRPPNYNFNAFVAAGP
ncbi:hypothetical protein FRC03_009283 [Tulasnella sp. 419]|nr:hypothetical protein FRC03_009283 [Tulasnella sp. 419]